MAREPDESEAIYLPLAGTRAQSIQRLQIGLSGLAAMALLVGLATIIMDRARQTDASAVPEAAATTQASAASTANDALADAGVAPEVAAPAKAGSGAKPAGQNTSPAPGQ
jgi:hypothetical protein